MESSRKPAPGLGEGHQGHQENGEEEKNSEFERANMAAKAEQSDIVRRALAMLHSRSERIPTLSGESHTVEALEVCESETIQGVKIASSVLGDEIWLILDRSFTSSDGLACYYAEEISLLRDKSPEELREIHKVKLAFPGCRVIQEGAERKG